ncbi:MAG: arginase [Oscillospiraceae bacterium]|nr:arginase [Oscillospiraceae bacterium]
MKLHMIEAPISAGSPTQGSECAFRAIRAAGLPPAFDAHEVSWVPMDPPAPSKDFPHHLKHLPQVQAVCKGVRERVLEALDEGAFPIILGGDHSIGMGSIAALGERFGPDQLSVVWIDAHTDINTDRSTHSGFIHGMPLAASMGLCCPELQMGRQSVNLKGCNTAVIGARSIDPPEYVILREQGVHLFTADRVSRDGLEAVLDEALFRLRTPALHISLDVDCLDPSVFTATGYVLPHGLLVTQVKTILRRLFHTGRVVSFELVEYNPALDSDGQGLAAVLELLAGAAENI